MAASSPPPPPTRSRSSRSTRTRSARLGEPIYNLWGQLRLAPNGSPINATIQWRAKDGSTPWVTIGDPVPVDNMGYFTATRQALLPVIGEWRAAIVNPADGSVVPGGTSLAQG